MVTWRLGTMGFSYKQWKDVFYPAGTAARDYLAYYAGRFNAVEMDSTFYGTPPVSHVDRWSAVTPADFIICPKTPRAITHEQRLVNAAEPMLTFLETMSALGEKLGAVLLQLPPDFSRAEEGALAAFLAQLPVGYRYAVEFRHRSWDTDATAELLAQHNIGWVSADYIHLPKVVHRTADFLYLRFLGRHGQFPNKTSEQVDKTAELQQWWEQIQPHLGSVTTVYGFFNNDYAGYSPATCNRFKAIVGVEAVDIRPGQWQQGRLF